MAFVYPTVYNRVIKAFFFKSPYPAIKADYYKILNPTIDYLHNNLFLGRYFLSGPEMKKPQMLELNLNERMTGLENELKYLLHNIRPLSRPYLCGITKPAIMQG